jgi:MFS family permease
MRADTIAIRALISIQLISMGAMEMSGPFWPLHIQTLLGPGNFIYSAMLSALVYAGPMLAAMAFTPYWGRMGDRLGHKLMMIRALFALALCQAIAAAVTDPWLLIVIRFAQGGLAGFLAAAQAYALSIGVHKGHGRLIAKLQSATAIGSLAGPVLGGALMEAYDFTLLCVSSALISLGCALISLWLPKPPSVPCRRDTPAAPLPGGWLGCLLLIIVLIQAAKLMPLPFYALYVTEILQGTPRLIGATYAISAASLALSAPLWARLFERRHPPKILQVIEWVIWGCALTVALGAVANEWITFVVSRLLWGVWQGALLPVAYALIASTLPQSRHGVALGLGNSAAKAGALCGVVIGGAGMNWLGLSFSFWLVAITYVVVALTLRVIRSNLPNALCPPPSNPMKTQQ